MYNPILNFYFSENRPSTLSVGNHSHNCYELVYFSKVKGNLSIRDASFSLNPGNIYFVYPGSVHSETHSSDYDVIFIGFECDNFPKDKLLEATYNIPEHKTILDLLLRIIEEATAQRENYQEITSHLLAEIILLMERYTNDNTYSVKSIEYAYNYIYEYYNQHINFSELAKSTGYSDDRFRHLFSEKYGTSPKQLQMTIRLEKAVELLAEKNLNCTVVAHTCGFSTSAQFSKLFKEQYGITPKQFASRYN